MAARFADTLSRDLLRRLAGARSFERGEEYFADGAVRPPLLEGETITATVWGTRPYRVALQPARGGGIAHSCTCPIGEDGQFCKHCVAVGLAAIEQRDELVARPAPISLDGLRSHLESLGREHLVELLLDEAAGDEALGERLRLRAAAATPGDAQLATFRQAIDRTIDPSSFVSYRDAREWRRAVDRLIDLLADLAAGGDAAAAIELCEHAFDRLEDAYGLIDDSDGHISDLIARLKELHVKACERGNPDPVALAERLVARRLDGELEIFLDALETHAGVLGDAGLNRYSELVRAEWDELPSVGPGDTREYGRPLRVRHAMEELARRGGDVDEVVSVMSQDLAYPYDFLQIARVCADAGRDRDAVDWCERGIEAFPERPDLRLHAFLAAAYTRAGRAHDALEITWDAFCERPALETYTELKPYADRVGAWRERRERALGVLRKRAAEFRATPMASYFGGHPRGDHSEIVRVLLWEGELDAAWEEAVAHGCHDGLWLELAERRKQEHPEDALRVYRPRVEPEIARTSKAGYEAAVRFLEEIGRLLRRLGRPEEFRALVAEIRETHARKRNLMALLDALELGEQEAVVR